MTDYILIGEPKRYPNGRGQRSKTFSQKFRLRGGKPTSVSLKTSDKTTARRRAVAYVEKRVREKMLKNDSKLRAEMSEITSVLKEYIDSHKAIGTTEKHIDLLNHRISQVIEQASFTKYKDVTVTATTEAIHVLQVKYKFRTNTANKYREAMRAWSKWMHERDYWDRHALYAFPKFRGDTSNSRRRAILTQKQFDTLLASVCESRDRRNLSGTQRYWLFGIASQTGLRAQECHSLTPASFYLDVKPGFVRIKNTISKRGKSTGKMDEIRLHRDFVEMLRPWLQEHDINERLFGTSRSWWYKAAGIFVVNCGGVVDLRLETAVASPSRRVTPPLVNRPKKTNTFAI